MEHLTRWLSQALEAHEREVVLGDLKESNATDWASFKQVLGLVARRRLPRWMALAALVPLILFLSTQTVAQAVPPKPQITLLLGMMDAWMIGYLLAKFLPTAVWTGLLAILAIAITATLMPAHQAWKYMGAGFLWRLAIPAVAFLIPLIVATMWNAGPSSARSHKATPE